MATPEKLILSIESAIEGGSIALSRGRTIIAESSGSVSRAGVLLAEVESLMDRTDVGLRNIEWLAVSVGPGSFTGIRVGISTMLGLQRALGVDLVGIPVLYAVAATMDMFPLATVLPMGRGSYACQLFEQFPESTKAAGTTFPFAVSEDELLEAIRKFQPECVALISTNACEMRDKLRKSFNVEIVDVGRLAGLIGNFAATYDGSASIEPIYLRPEHNSK